jgi:hypothetical protein
MMQTTQSFRQIADSHRWPTGTTSTLQYENRKILRMDIGAQNRFKCPSGAQAYRSCNPNAGHRIERTAKSIAKISGVMG